MPLPTALVIHTLQFLLPTDLGKSACVARSWRIAANSPQVYLQYAKPAVDLGKSPLNESKKNDETEEDTCSQAATQTLEEIRKAEVTKQKCLPSPFTSPQFMKKEFLFYTRKGREYYLTLFKTKCRDETNKEHLKELIQLGNIFDSPMQSEELNDSEVHAVWLRKDDIRSGITNLAAVLNQIPLNALQKLAKTPERPAVVRVLRSEGGEPPQKRLRY